METVAARRAVSRVAFPVVGSWGGTWQRSSALPLMTARTSPAAWARVTLLDSPLLRRGAAADRPSQYLHPKTDTRYSSLARLELCLVRRSAGFSSPRTFLRSTLLLRTACWIHNVWVSKCRILPSPWRQQMPLAALESVQTRKGTLTPRSSKRALYPRP